MEKHHCCEGAFPTEISKATTSTVNTVYSNLILDRIVTKDKAKILLKKFKDKLKDELGQVDQSDIDALETSISSILTQLSSHTNNTNIHVTQADKTRWDNHFSGDYEDLTNKPTIPTVGDGTVSVKVNGEVKGSFTTNQDTNTTIDLGVIQSNVDLSEYALKTEIPDISGLATKSEIPDVSNLQEKLVAGTNISITGNVISSTGSTSSVDVDTLSIAEIQAMCTEIYGGSYSSGSGSISVNSLEATTPIVAEGINSPEYSLNLVVNSYEVIDE